jgi:Bacterial Ig-like domain
MLPRRFVAGFLAVFCCAGLAWAQTYSQYEMRYGEPVEVSISDLASTPSAYENRAVRTHGRLEIDPAGGFRNYTLRGGFGDRVRVAPVPDVASAFEGEVLQMVGRDLDVTGVFLPAAQGASGTQVAGGIQFWKYFGEPPELKDASRVPSATLEQLSTNPARFEGRLIRVVGQFRGRNLFGDLPVTSQTNRSDWVVKDDVYAVWITGRRPKGDGFDLDATLKRDTGKWLEVVGRVDVRRGFAYLQAQRVSLTTPPTPTARAEPPKPLVDRPRVPPMVIFTLPLDGENDVPGAVRFAVQFSKDMDEDSFKGHVVLRYSGRPQAGDRDLDGVAMRYDGGRRALIVDPGDILRPGRQVELLFLPGIQDLDGLALVPRRGTLPEGAQVVDVLRWRIGL